MMLLHLHQSSLPALRRWQQYHRLFGNRVATFTCHDENYFNNTAVRPVVSTIIRSNNSLMLVGYKQVMMKTTGNIPSMNHKILNLQYLNNNFGQTLRHFGSRSSSGNKHGTGTRGRGGKLNELAMNILKLEPKHNQVGGPIDTGTRGRGGNLNEFGHHYTKIGGPIDTSVCGLSETEINNLIRARMECKMKRDFQRADKIQAELQQHGVFIRDQANAWRADGKVYNQSSL